MYRKRLERITKSDTHPVATSGTEQTCPIHTETNIGSLGGDSGSGAAGESGSARGEDILVEDVGIDVSGFVEGERQHIKVEVDMAMRRQLPVETGCNLRTIRSGRIEDVISGVDSVVHLVAIPVDKVVAHWLEGVGEVATQFEEEGDITGLNNLIAQIGRVGERRTALSVPTLVLLIGGIGVERIQVVGHNPIGIELAGRHVAAQM